MGWFLFSLFILILTFPMLVAWLTLPIVAKREKLKYGVKVKIASGFWKDRIGIVLEHQEARTVAVGFLTTNSFPEGYKVKLNDPEQVEFFKFEEIEPYEEDNGKD